MKSSIASLIEYNGNATPRALHNEWILVQQAIAGDSNALDLLLAPNLNMLYQVARTILRNRQDAEDALQEGLCTAFRHLGSFRGRSMFSTWLTRIVINSALMTLRKRISHPESSLDEALHDEPKWSARLAIDDRPNPEQVCTIVELHALVEKQIGKLPRCEQIAFRFFAVNGFSIKESCQALGVPEGTFKSRIHRARRKLAQGLQEPFGKRYDGSSKGKSSHVVEC